MKLWEDMKISLMIREFIDVMIRSQDSRVAKHYYFIMPVLIFSGSESLQLVRGPSSLPPPAVL